MKQKILSFLITLVFLNINLFADKIIVNINNPVRKLSRASVRQIFMGQKSRWPHNSRIQVADYKADFTIRRSFSEFWLNQSPYQVYRSWLRVSLSGQALPPHILGSEQDLVNFIANNSNAIGYISDDTPVPANVKVIHIE